MNKTERIFKIEQMIASRQVVAFKAMLEELEVSRATLNRDLELSFIDQYPARIGALTKAQVNGAIKQHLDPEKMVLVKAGTVPGAK